MCEIEITSENFDSEVKASTKPVLLDFWATWCGPCSMIAPIIKEIAQEYQGRVIVGKVNVDSNPMLSSQFSITSIPTLVVMKDGEIVNQTVGLQTKEQIVTLLAQAGIE